MRISQGPKLNDALMLLATAPVDVICGFVLLGDRHNEHAECPQNLENPN